MELKLLVLQQENLHLDFLVLLNLPISTPFRYYELIEPNL